MRLGVGVSEQRVVRTYHVYCFNFKPLPYGHSPSCAIKHQKPILAEQPWLRDDGNQVMNADLQTLELPRYRCSHIRRA